MKLRILIITSWKRSYAALSAQLARYWKNTFYLYLAAIFTIFAIADTSVFHFTAEMRQAAFDTMLHYRIVKPRPDPDIVIVDINEASLAAMAKDYGRWPWPRQVLGEFVEQVEKQNPKAIVFDILFSDADLYNADSDAYFDAAIAKTNNTFFPMLRLDSSFDPLSQVKAAMIPGVEQALQGVQPDATMAVVLPHFQSALDSGRLGLHNIESDDDSIARQYLVYKEDYGWKLPSLPARIGRDLGWPSPEAQRVLLNWRGAPFTYHYVSFFDVFQDLTSKEKHRPANEFAGKIIIIGSTAPSLFDIKPTPMSQMHPGVEILATAIDNFKHDDYLRFPDAHIPYLLLALAIIWATAWGFYRGIGMGRMDRWFGSSQFILIGISYASINLSTTYINLTAPVSLALTFFGIARLYSSATGKALEHNAVRISMRQEGELQATLLLMRLDTNLLTDMAMEDIRYGLATSSKEVKSVEVVNGDQKGLWDLFEKTYAVSWVSSAQDITADLRIQKDVEIVLSALPALLRRHLMNVDNVASWFVHHGSIAGGDAAKESWRALFAETLVQWQKSKLGGQKK
jgi:CHASE2 domain-containing sensor protein